MASPNHELRARIRAEILRQWQTAAASDGPRPTIDSVHAEMGGSKLTIGKVLSDVRDEAFSAMLNRAKIPSIPQAHQAVLQEFYAQLVEQAEQAADAKRNAEREADQVVLRTANQATADAIERERVAKEHNGELLRQVDAKNAEIGDLQSRLQALDAAAKLQLESHQLAEQKLQDALVEQRATSDVRERELTERIAQRTTGAEVLATQLRERDVAAETAAARQQVYEASLIARVATAETATDSAKAATAEAQAQILRQQTQLIESESTLAVARAQLGTVKNELAAAHGRVAQLSDLAASQSNELASMRTELEVLRRVSPNLPSVRSARKSRAPRA